MYSAIRKLYARKRHDWHEARADLFMDVIHPCTGQTVLDLGGGDGEFMERVRRRADIDVTVADISDDALHVARARGFKTVKISDTGPLPFVDKQFDVVFSNSVIEHATMPKSEVHRDLSDADWDRIAKRHQSRFRNLSTSLRHQHASV